MKTVCMDIPTGVAGGRLFSANHFLLALIFLFVFAPCPSLGAKEIAKNNKKIIEVFKLESRTKSDGCKFFSYNKNNLSCKEKFYISDNDFKMSQLIITDVHFYRTGLGGEFCPVENCPVAIGQEFSVLDPFSIFNNKSEFYIVKRISPMIIYEKRGRYIVEHCYIFEISMILNLKETIDRCIFYSNFETIMR